LRCHLASQCLRHLPDTLTCTARILRYSSSRYQYTRCSPEPYVPVAKFTLRRQITRQSSFTSQTFHSNEPFILAACGRGVGGICANISRLRLVWRPTRSTLAPLRSVRSSREGGFVTPDRGLNPVHNA
jgi:hypothetical protein